MIVDLYDAIDRMLWAIVAWIAVFAAVGTVVLLSGLALGMWAVKRAWRALSGPCGASDAPEAAPDVRDAPEPADGRTAPRWAHDEQGAA